MLETVLKGFKLEEVDALSVYSDIFSIGSGYIQRKGEPPGQYKANPLGYYRMDGENRGHYRILFEDDFWEQITELQNADFSIINGITYFGRRNLLEHASKMFAMIFDIDGVEDIGLANLLSGGFNSQFDIYPLPNYVILSGHGIHLYYIFERPISLFPYTKIQLKSLKYALTERLWNRYTSVEKKPQYQGINQGFRVIGGKTKIDGIRVRAFHVSDVKHTLQSMGLFVPAQSRVDENKLFKESKITLEEARMKWPEWYQSVVVEGQSRRYWEVKRDLYDWWKLQIQNGTTYGHRYFAIMCLAIYAAKCNISANELKKDALNFVPYLNSINKANPFTIEDVKSALECFDKKYCTFPLQDIEKLSGIPIKRNKRNGRNQKVHLEMARSIQKIKHKYDGENWREGNGRPKGSGTKKQMVNAWRVAHPDGKKSECQRETGLSRPTIMKWWERR